ncbi:ABC transporter ATP-binding protein [Halioxenophilus aromaticivorans]|uniref:ABC transporter ATP-binding protein n=1 Tax=Halioxenophilus aromaticivorans TaxID=1306992 RepID=A0AAV3TYW4_9ALTE
MSFLQLQDIACGYGDSSQYIVKQLNLALAEGGIACLLGPSGCGKTTVLRAIAGFHGIDQGDIRLGGRVLSNAQYTEPPERRQIGLVFQDYALFPHLTVVQNIAFGLYKQATAEQAAVCEQMLALVQLSDMAGRYPHELSGGQQQRVALARALAARPRLLLLDEPFSNLDVELRRALALEVRNILKQQQITAIMVTHDQEEAFAFADHIGVMQGGQLHQWDTPYNLYHKPANPFVANFVGQGVFLAGTWQNQDTLCTEFGQTQYSGRQESIGAVQVLLRPDDVIHDPTSSLSGQVVAKVFAGTTTLYTLELQSQARVLASLPSHLDFNVAETIPISLNLEHPISFAAQP